MDRLKALATFKMVVDKGGFARAAAELDVSCAQVTRCVQELEALLGVRLLQRTTRAISLTEEGEAFYAAARRIVGEIETLENQISGQSGTPHGLLKVTTSLAFSTHQLAPVIAEFLERYPLLQLELMPTDRVVDMIEEGVDVADPGGDEGPRHEVEQAIAIDQLLQLVDGAERQHEREHHAEAREDGARDEVRREDGRVPARNHRGGKVHGYNRVY